MDELERASSYTNFVKILQADQKSKAFMDFLKNHYGEKDYVGTLKKSTFNKGQIECKKLEITQNNISLSKSLGVLSNDLNWLKKILNTPQSAFDTPVITYGGKYIIDGHHRWSKVYALNGGDAKVEVINFPVIDGVSWKDMLKAVQLAAVASNPSIELVNKVGDDNMLTMSIEQIEKYVKSNAQEETIEIYKEFKSDLDSADKIASYCGKNAGEMQKTCGNYSDKPARDVMPQTDKAPNAIKKLSNVVYDIKEGFEDEYPWEEEEEEDIYEDELDEIFDVNADVNLDLHNFGGSGNTVDILGGGLPEEFEGEDEDENEDDDEELEELFDANIGLTLDAHEFGGNDNNVDVL